MVKIERSNVDSIQFRHIPTAGLIVHPIPIHSHVKSAAGHLVMVTGIYFDLVAMVTGAYFDLLTMVTGAYFNLVTMVTGAYFDHVIMVMYILLL